MTDDGDWRDHESGRTGLSVGGLRDGDSMEVQGTSEPFRRDTEEADDALHVPVVVIEAPDYLEDMSGDPVDVYEGDDEEPTEYHIINSSSAFFEALTRAFPPGAEVNGTPFRISVEQPDDAYSRTYSIEAV